MFPLPFTGPTYSLANAFENQISQNTLLLAHIPTAVISLAFAIWLYHHTKKLSALYLLFITIAFSIWTYLDFAAWTGSAQTIMFSWSILDIFSTFFTILTYWFFYAFVKEEDVPFWQKLVSLCFLIPPIAYVLSSVNMTTFYNPQAISLENEMTRYYVPMVGVVFLCSVLTLAIIEYRKTTDITAKQKILWVTLATGLFLSIFLTAFLITNALLRFSTNLAQYAYNVSVYSLFGMPFLTGILTYLIVKYQAFNVTVIKSILYILICMAILFVNIFLPY
jgi:hypothetical protein